GAGAPADQMLSRLLSIAFRALSWPAEAETEARGATSRSPAATRGVGGGVEVGGAARGVGERTWGDSATPPATTGAAAGVLRTATVPPRVGAGEGGLERHAVKAANSAVPRASPANRRGNPKAQIPSLCPPAR